MAKNGRRLEIEVAGQSHEHPSPSGDSSRFVGITEPEVLLRQEPFKRGLKKASKRLGDQCIRTILKRSNPAKSALTDSPGFFSVLAGRRNQNHPVVASRFQVAAKIVSLPRTWYFHIAVSLRLVVDPKQTIPKEISKLTSPAREVSKVIFNGENVISHSQENSVTKSFNRKTGISNSVLLHLFL